MTKVIVAGLIGRFPVGGNTWAYLQYVLGLKRLGYDVYYLEDSADFLCYDLDLNVTDRKFDYCINYLKNVMNAKIIGLANKWALRVGNECYGMSESEIVNLCKDTELLINVSGSVLVEPWVANRWQEDGQLNMLSLERNEYKKINKRVFIDTDPGFNQFKVANDPEHKDHGSRSFASHDVYFTYAENIGAPDCGVPDCGFRWNKTRQPIILDMWPSKIDPSLDKFTSVMNWSAYKPITYDSQIYGQKDVELRKFIDLPHFTDQKIELAMSGGIKPKELLDQGWKLVSGIAKERRDMWAYQRYIQRSRAEWSVAKNIYVKTRSGWFSERSACYLASAKPVLAQDTCFSKYLPTGEGLIAFSDMDGILNGIDLINSDYIFHCEASRRIAEEYFDSDKVLKELLRQVGF